MFVRQILVGFVFEAHFNRDGVTFLSVEGTLLPFGVKVAVKDVIFSIFQKLLKTITMAFW